MRKSWRAQFSLRTALLAMLALGVTPWLVTRYVRWRENQVWSAFYTAVHDRDDALRDWRTLHSIREDINSWKQAEAETRNRYFSAKQRIDGKLTLIRSFCDESSEEFKRAMEIRVGKRAIPERDRKSLAQNAK